MQGKTKIRHMKPAADEDDCVVIDKACSRFGFGQNFRRLNNAAHGLYQQTTGWCAHHAFDADHAVPAGMKQR